MIGLAPLSPVSPEQPRHPCPCLPCAGFVFFIDWTAFGLTHLRRCANLSAIQRAHPSAHVGRVGTVKIANCNPTHAGRAAPLSSLFPPNPIDATTITDRREELRDSLPVPRRAQGRGAPGESCFVFATGTCLVSGLSAVLASWHVSPLSMGYSSGLTFVVVWLVSSRLV